MHPKPGGKIAEAIEYGIDVGLIVENLRLSPEERLERLQQAMIGFSEMKRTARRLKQG